MEEMIRSRGSHTKNSREQVNNQWPSWHIVQDGISLNLSAKDQNLVLEVSLHNEVDLSHYTFEEIVQILNALLHYMYSLALERKI